MQITLILAENYLPLKLGEAWVELERDIATDKIKPLGLDAYVTSILAGRLRTWSEHIKKIQENYVQRDRFIEFYKENTLYAFLKDINLVESLDVLKEMDYVARTTERMFRLMAKMKQRIDLSKDILILNKMTMYHSTFLHDINVTVSDVSSMFIQFGNEII